MYDSAKFETEHRAQPQCVVCPMHFWDELALYSQLNMENMFKHNHAQVNIFTS